jgi:hypothetical protein
MKRKIENAATFNGGPGEEGMPHELTPHGPTTEQKPKRTRRPRTNGSLDALLIEFQEKKTRLIQRYQSKMLKLMER